MGAGTDLMARPIKTWRPTPEQFAEWLAALEMPLPALPMPPAAPHGDPLPIISPGYAARLQSWIDGGCVGDRPIETVEQRKEQK